MSRRAYDGVADLLYAIRQLDEIAMALAERGPLAAEQKDRVRSVTLRLGELREDLRLHVLRTGS